MCHKTDDNVFVNYKRIWDEQIFSLKSPNFEFKFLYSDDNISEEYQIQGNNLITNCVENYWGALLLKVINGFDYFIQNDFDLVFKTNLSTIINFEKFYEYCKQISKSKEFIFQKAFFFHRAASTTITGPNPAINIGRTESPAPAFN